MQAQNEDSQKVDAQLSETGQEHVPSQQQTPATTASASASIDAQTPNNIVGFSQQTASQNPYADTPHMLTHVHAAERAEAVTGSAQPSHVPVEFDPNNFTQTHTPYALQQAAATAFARPEPMPHETVPSAVPQSYAPPAQNAPLSAPPLTGGVDVGHVEAGNVTGNAPLNYNDVESLPAGDPLLPYADPAYAEERMDEVRIGDDGQSKKKSLFKRKKKNKVEITAKAPKANNGESTSLFTGRNLRVAALATGITLIGLFAAKTVLFGNETPLFESNNSTFPSDGTFVQDNGSTASSDIMSGAVPTIGEYTDNKIQPLSAGGADTLEAAAANGNAIAQFQLGLSNLEQGKTEQAVTLIRAASQTLPAAQYRLAKLYETGTGVEKNTEMAKDLTERAARSGNRIAMHDLAIYYAYGNGGVNVDMGTAAGWFEKAAERGVVDSQFNLAILFENGQGVKPSPADAYFWYSIAASQGDQTANARIIALDEIMAPAEIAAAKERAANFTPVAINQPANGIFKNLPWNKDNERRAAERSAQVKQVQTLLNDLGFDAGTADGIMGRKTRQAINSFERVNGLNETGQISEDLIDRLSVAAGA
jgi:TPR repeat protein